MSSEVEIFLASPLAWGVVFVFGALWGSFFNVCIARVPRGMSVVRPGSHCFACKAPVQARDNIPIVSYLLLRGRCRACGAQFSARYAGVELLSGLLSVAVFQVFVAAEPQLPLGVRVAAYFTYFAFCGVLLVLSFIDFDTKRLPDVITLPSIPIFFLAGFGTQFEPWLPRAIGAGAGYLAVRLVSDAYYYLRGREGLGLGDGKLLAIVGAALGWQALPPVIFVASFLGLAISVPVLLAARARGAPQPTGAVAQPPAIPEPTSPKDPAPLEEDAAEEPEEPDEAQNLRFVQVPFGPFLAAAAVAYLLLHDAVAPTVINLLGGG